MLVNAQPLAITIFRFRAIRTSKKANVTIKGNSDFCSRIHMDRSNQHTLWYQVCSYSAGECFFLYTSQKEHLKQFTAPLTMLLRGYFKPPALSHNLVHSYTIWALLTFGSRSINELQNWTHFTVELDNPKSVLWLPPQFWDRHLEYTNSAPTRTYTLAPRPVN